MVILLFFIAFFIFILTIFILIIVCAYLLFMSYLLFLHPLSCLTHLLFLLYTNKLVSFSKKSTNKFVFFKISILNYVISPFSLAISCNKASSFFFNFLGRSTCTWYKRSPRFFLYKSGKPSFLHTIRSPNCVPLGMVISL